MVIAIFDAAMGITSGMILYHTVPVFKRKLKDFAKNFTVYSDDPVCH